MNHIRSDLEIQKIHDSLYKVHGVFNEDTLCWLKTFFDYNNRFDVDWQFQGPFTRLLYPKLITDPVFSSIINEWQTVIAKIYDQPLQPMQAKLWLDLPGHRFLEHRDSADIKVMTQIYLWSNDESVTPGTTFLEPEVISIPFKYNCGYININDPQKLHCTDMFTTYRCSMGLLYTQPI